MVNKLKLQREQQALTMKELAELLDITENYIYMIESGLRSPSFKLAKKIADLFNCTVDALFFEDTPNETLDKRNTKVG